MSRGGYKIIDFKNNNLSDTAVIIHGIYESIEENYYKPLLFSNIIVNGNEYPDIFTQVKILDGNYVIQAYDGVITITDNDIVTYNIN